MFFIGNGYADSATLVEQTVYTIPAGATRLFLGYPSRLAVGSAPGWYYDDSGSWNVDVTFE